LTEDGELDKENNDEIKGFILAENPFSGACFTNKLHVF